MSPKKMETIKNLTPQEIESIKDLQKKYNDFIFELGSIEAQTQLMNVQLDVLKDDKNNVLIELNKIGDVEKELIDTLQTKYGVGNIDISSGTFTPTN